MGSEGHLGTSLGGVSGGSLGGHSEVILMSLWDPYLTLISETS